MKVNPRRRNVINNFDQLFNEFFNDQRPARHGFARQNPLTNIIETKDGFRLELAVPGLTKEDIEIKVDKDILTISAEKEITKNEDEKVLRHSFSYNKFERTFQLPETIDTEKIDANFEHGVLIVNLQKKEEAKELPARTITIS